MHLGRRLDFPEARREVAWGPHRNSRGTSCFKLQLKKNHDIPPSKLDEALFPCSALKAIQSSQLKCERRLDSLYAFQEVPRVTRRNLRGIPSFLLQLEKSPVFPTSSRDEGQFPCFNSRGIPTFPSHLKSRPVSPVETREEPHCSCLKAKEQPVSLQLEIRPDSPALTRMEHEVSPHNKKGDLTPLIPTSV